MARIASRRRLGLGLLIATVIAAAVLLAGHRQKPEIRLASLSQLKGAVPQELLVEPPEDSHPEAPFDALVKLGKTLDQKDADQLALNWGRVAPMYEGHPHKRKVSLADERA